MKSLKRHHTLVYFAIAAVAATLATVILTRHSAASASSTSATMPAPSDVRPIQYVDDLTHVSAVSRSAWNPSSALDMIQQRLSAAGAATEIASATVEVPPPPHDISGTWLHFVTAAPAADEGSLHAQWQTNLVAGAVADAVSYAGSSYPVTGTTIDIRLPDGTILREQGGGFGDIAPGQNFANPSSSAIRSAIEPVLANSGLKLIRFGVTNADQAAPDVVVQTDDAIATAQDAQSLISSLFLKGHQPIYEGYYFEVRDAANKPILIQASSFRTGVGDLWFSPTIRDVISLNHG